MALLRRLALAVSMVLCCSFAFATASMAAGPGGPPGPPPPPPAGIYHTATLRAHYSLNLNKGGQFPSISITVMRTTQESKPLGGPSTVTTETDLNFFVFDGTTPNSGCFILTAPGDFTVSKDLKTAALKTTIPGANVDCGSPSTLPPGLVIDVAWTGTDAIATSRDSNRFDCLTYRSETTTTDGSNNASAVATMTPLLAGPFAADQAGFGSGDQRIHAQGTFQPSCPPGPGGKGAGRGPLPAGKYHFVNEIAVFSVFTPSGPISISVNRGTNTSHPVGAPSTTTTETDVNVFDPSSPFPFICFVLDTTPPNLFTFSSGLQSAVLHAKTTASTKTCGPPGGPPPPPLPSLTVDVSWSGTGPIATTHDRSHFACLTFSQATTSLGAINNANATATVPELFTGPLTASFANLVSSDVRTHVKGVDPDPCIFRS
jgi:hypothetical protein